MMTYGQKSNDLDIHRFLDRRADLARVLRSFRRPSSSTHIASSLSPNSAFHLALRFISFAAS
jgi:hypothetical protein